MKINIDVGKIVTAIIIATLMFSAGAVVEFQSLKKEVKKNTKQLTKDDKRINVMSKLMCVQAIKNNVEHAAELCKEIMSNGN